MGQSLGCAAIKAPESNRVPPMKVVDQTDDGRTRSQSTVTDMGSKSTVTATVSVVNRDFQQMDLEGVQKSVSNDPFISCKQPESEFNTELKKTEISGTNMYSNIRSSVKYNKDQDQNLTMPGKSEMMRIVHTDSNNSEKSKSENQISSVQLEFIQERLQNHIQHLFVTKKET